MLKTALVVEVAPELIEIEGFAGAVTSYMMLAEAADE